MGIAFIAVGDIGVLFDMMSLYLVAAVVIPPPLLVITDFLPYKPTGLFSWYDRLSACKSWFLNAFVLGEAPVKSQSSWLSANASSIMLLIL